jgi:Helix-turn-helix of DDE superfamily endonuclease
MLSYDTVKDHPQAFRACTGLDVVEFEAVLGAFTTAWHHNREQTSVLGKERKRAPGAGRKAKLARIEDKLFFILFYFKTYPLQEVLAVLFGMSQSQTNTWIHTLSAVLKTALGQEHHLPARDPHTLEAVLAECDTLAFLLDGIERRRQRPDDNDVQKEYYSGKKRLTPIRIT